MITVDRWKCAWNQEWIEEAQRKGSIYIHFPFVTDPEGLGDVDWAEVTDLMAKTGTPMVNIHLSADPEKFVEEAGREEKLRDVALRCVGELCERFGPEKVAVENVVSRANGGLSAVEAVRPELISWLLEQTGAGLILDTAHLRLNCLEQGWDLTATLDQMPLDRLKELHITGVSEARGILHDSMPMGAEDWALAEDVFSRIDAGAAGRPWCVALEYGGIGPVFEWRSEPDVMETDTDQLRRLLNRMAP